jgi:hypothetical protein
MFLFRAYERPDFVTLQTAHAHVADVLIVVLGTGGTKINQQFCHCVNGNVSKAAGSAKAVSLY